MKEALPEIIRISKMAILPCCKIARLKWTYANFPPNWLICWYKGSTGHRSFIGFNDWEPHLVYGKNRSNLYMHDYFHTRASFKKGTFNHPCPKPLEWARWIIERASKENDIICDPFLGSGTTCIVAKELNRRFIGIEIDKEYCIISSERISCEIINYDYKVKDKVFNEVKKEEPKVDWKKMFDVST